MADLNPARPTLKERWRSLLDRFSRAVFGGIDANELRAILRGEDAVSKPNQRYRAHVLSMLLHIRPRYYAAASTRFTYTFRLGFLSVLFFFIELITGIILMLYYVSTPEGAYLSILRLSAEIPFGELTRDIHRLAAEGMVITTVLHLVRTYLTASYKKERKFTWLTGVILFLFTLVFAFSGYLLPWDQLAYWAVTIGTSMAAAVPIIGDQISLIMRGGPDIGADGLLRFYQVHVILLPVLTAVVLSVHYYRVSRIHSISLPAWVEEGNPSEEQKREATRRIDLVLDLLTHEWFWIALSIFLLVLASLFFYDAPLESPANPIRTPLEPQAPWFFLWVQGLLKLGDVALWGVVVPGILVLLLFLLPYLDRNPHRLARKRIPEIVLAVVVILALVMLSFMGTARYGITFQPALEVSKAFAPDEHPGLVHRLAFDDLPVGVYSTGEEYEALPADFSSLLDEVDGLVLAAFEGSAEQMQTWVVVEERQVNLKQVTLRLQWQDQDESTELRTYERVVYIHRDLTEP